MKLHKTAYAQDHGNGLGTELGNSYEVIGHEHITISPAGNRWIVYKNCERIRAWDSFKFAKEHAEELTRT